jgi:hypothetical protein
LSADLTARINSAGNKVFEPAHADKAGYFTDTNGNPIHMDRLAEFLCGSAAPGDASGSEEDSEDEEAQFLDGRLDTRLPDSHRHVYLTLRILNCSNVTLREWILPFSLCFLPINSGPSDVEPFGLCMLLRSGVFVIRPS